VITNNEALLWTDHHYFIQAAKELDPTCWKLMSGKMKNTPSIINWLAQVNQI